MISPVQICPIDGISNENKKLLSIVYQVMPEEIQISNTKINKEYLKDKVFLISMKEYIAIQKLEIDNYDITGMLIDKNFIINLN